MISNKKVDNALSIFGLTQYESEVYKSLIVDGITTARNVSNICGIPYGKTYEVLYSLSKKGFIDILPTKPMRYKVNDPKYIVQFVTESIRKRLEDSAEIIMDYLAEPYKKVEKKFDKKNNFWILNGRLAINKRVEKMFSKAIKSINILTTENGMERLHFYKDTLKKARNKHVKVNVYINHTLAAKNPYVVVSIDKTELLFFEPIPDDKSISSGRDFGILILNPTTASFFDNLFSSCQTSFKREDS